MDEGSRQLRDRMLRDAIIEVLRGVFPCSDEANRISVVDMGLVQDVTVDGDRIQVELVLASGWRHFAAYLVTEVQRHLQPLPEVARSKVEVVWEDAPDTIVTNGGGIK